MEVVQILLLIRGGKKFIQSIGCNFLKKKVYFNSNFFEKYVPKKGKNDGPRKVTREGIK